MSKWHTVTPETAKEDTQYMLVKNRKNSITSNQTNKKKRLYNKCDLHTPLKKYTVNGQSTCIWKGGDT